MVLTIAISIGWCDSMSHLRVGEIPRRELWSVGHRRSVPGNRGVSQLED